MTQYPSAYPIGSITQLSDKPIHIDIDSARLAIDLAEESARQATAAWQEKEAGYQEYIGKLKGLLELSHAFMRRCYPRLNEREMPRQLMKAIADELWKE